MLLVRKYGLFSITETNTAISAILLCTILSADVKFAKDSNRWTFHTGSLPVLKTPSSTWTTHLPKLHKPSTRPRGHM